MVADYVCSKVLEDVLALILLCEKKWIYMR